MNDSTIHGCSDSNKLVVESLAIGSALASRSENAERPPIGLVAGWGRFPFEVVASCRHQGRQVVIAGIKNHADGKLAEYARKFQWFGVAKLGAMIAYFKRQGVAEVALAGKLFKDRILFHGLGWIGHFPDLTALRAIYGSFVSKTLDQRDDTILGAVVQAFEEEGLRILSAGEIAPALLVEPGNLTSRRPNAREKRDIAFGWNIAKAMGKLDIGQNITVRDQTVLGVEAIEGTDSPIDRTKALCPRGGFTLIKVAKPLQDMRFDVPTIGSRTIEKLHRAGGRAIAIEARKTILVDRVETLKRADELGIAIESYAFGDSLLEPLPTCDPNPFPPRDGSSELTPSNDEMPLVLPTLGERDPSHLRLADQISKRHQPQPRRRSA